MSYLNINKLLITSFAALYSCSLSAEILFQDSFESGNLSHSENNISWGATNYSERRGDFVSVSNDNAKSGSYSLRLYFNGQADLSEDSWAEQRFDLGGNYGEIWIKYDLYVPGNYYHRTPIGPANNKGVMQIWSGSYQSSDQYIGFEHYPNDQGSSWITYHPMPGSNDMGHEPGGGLFIDRSKDLGKWVEYIVHLKVASSANNDGVVRVWKMTEGYPRETIVNVDNLNNYITSGNFFTTGYLLGWANSGYTDNTTFYIDDVVISTTPISMKQPRSPILSVQ